MEGPKRHAHPRRRSGQTGIGWFDLAVPERAYLFGLLQTDGSHTQGTRNRGRIQLELAGSDAALLEQLVSLCPWHSTVRYRTRDTNFRADYQSAVWTLSSWDARIELTDLGFPPGPKSHSASPPIVPHSERDYLRGLIDGDGSLGFTSAGRPFVSFVSASEPLARYVEARFEALTGVRRRTNRTARDGLFNPMLQSEAAVAVATHLYHPGDLALARKAEVSSAVSAWVRPATMRRAYTARRWTAAEDEIVRSDIGVAAAAALLKRTVSSVSMRRWRLARDPRESAG